MVCYTNHALDQFLEDLLKIGIPAEDMVRLGGKSTAVTKPLSMFERTNKSAVARDTWKAIEKLRLQADSLVNRLRAVFDYFWSSPLQYSQVMEYLEFIPEDSVYYQAFAVPKSEDGMSIIGRRGKKVNEFYLLDQWIAGKDAGVYKSSVGEESRKVWEMTFDARQSVYQRWIRDILKEEASVVYAIAAEYNECQAKIESAFNTRYASQIGTKRIIACTTTAAAKYVKEVQTASPDVLIVEEAGEILESHILTALGDKTKQLVLIGDHKQLRPKVANHRLSVEYGDGYDLNRSLFERLVLKGFPHQTLSEQYRMRPEISALVRHLTYPKLKDAAGTKRRPNVRGLQDNVIFVSHSYPEDENTKMPSQSQKMGSSKQNRFEAEMVLRCVRYLAQQGYGSDKIVVLTPYLAQLSLLRETLSIDNDPVLNDLDSYDLVSAGLMTAASANLAKRPLSISTIDNYQGEESDIVVTTLTRSNPSCDIGWMATPERLNVLLSRARDALIMIGNPETFLNARKGKEEWIRFFEILRHNGHVYDGFPVKCERHPDRKSILSKPAEFGKYCPDGGCNEPW